MTIKEASILWNVSERSVRNYCALGRVGRMIAFKECLKNNIVPFIILDSKKMFYYRGLKNWNKEHIWLIGTCLDGQDTVKAYLDYFGINY